MFFGKSKPKAEQTEWDYTKQGVVDEEIKPYRAGRVRYGGTYWFARCREAVTIKEGEWVCVVGRENTTLFVVREPWHLET